ncbi:cytoskeleton-associated protein 4 [Pangasianodon hypophthalmus]|uniref:cytoskeleton-associated protein 4 n=1 Tax=Pangasianodon hypophthalmus TaxID=310915 RepID=UPI002307CA33|nr:cytoskeleton-associated protein 4 [Pangasianodon hypophthalmus]
MPSKNKNKGANSTDKAAVNPQDDAAKKSPKVSKADSSANSRPGSGKLTKLLSALSYMVLVSGAAFASFYLQRVLTEVNQIRSESEEALQKNAEVLHRVEHALQQVNSMKFSLEGLEAAVGRTQAELESANRAIIKGETETRRVEEVLQKLQNEILRDLSEGIREVKQAREHDFSSLEKTLEVRLAELSRSIADSVAEFTGAQEEAQAQLSDLRIRLEEQNEPGNLKNELMAITTAVAGLHTANEVAEGNIGVLREQIVSVNSELQTRNKEVASLSEELEAVRSLVQTTAGSLRQEVSASQAIVQAMSDQIQNAQDEQLRTSQAVQSLQIDLMGELSKRETREDDLEARLKITEESIDTIANLATEQTSRVEAFLSKHDSHESSLAAQSQVAEKARQALKEELEELRGSLGELQASIDALADTNTRLEGVALEESVLQTEQLQNDEWENAGQKEEAAAEEVVEEVAAEEAVEEVAAEEAVEEVAAEEAVEEVAAEEAVEEVAAEEVVEEEATTEEVVEEEAGAEEVVEEETQAEEVVEEDFTTEEAVEEDSVTDEVAQENTESEEVPVEEEERQ